MSVDYDIFMIDPSNKDATFEQCRDSFWEAISELWVGGRRRILEKKTLNPDERNNKLKKGE